MAKSVSKKQKKTASAPRPKNTTRRLKKENYKSFRLQKRIKHSRPKVLGAFRIMRAAIQLLLKNWKLFGGILIIYIILDIILVKGLNGSNEILELKEASQEIFGGGTAQLSTGVALFSYLLSTAGTSSTELAGAYHSMLSVIVSLAIIWALRIVSARKTAGIRDSFYRGMYPLVPFLLVLLVIGLQMIPLVISNFLYGIVFVNGLATTGLEQFLWAIILFLLVLLSLYMVCSSIFALYISTLPDMRPMQALRSARELVLYRRWLVLRKVLFLPLVLLPILAILMMPIVLYLTPAAEWVFFVLSMLSLAIVHSYMYTLYRELL